MNQDCPMTIIGYLDTLIKKAMKDGDKELQKQMLNIL